MNELMEYFRNNKGRLIHKWVHYFEIYDRHFAKFRNQGPHVLEIGVADGGSLQMWKHYFGESARIYGIDVEPRCKGVEEEGIEVFIGNQEDREFLRLIREMLPRIDIVIDDGGHTVRQQICSFEELFPHLSENGVYLCEDLHTSYWVGYGGGYRKPNTFIEFSKDLIDHLNAWHSLDAESFRVSDFTRSAYSMHYYDSVLVVEKRRMSTPHAEMTGSPSFG